MNFFTPKKTITLKNTEKLASVMSETKFRSKSLILHPIYSLKKKNEINDVTNKVIPIEITQVTDDLKVVTGDLKGSGMVENVSHAFNHPAGMFRTEDSVAVGHSSFDSGDGEKDGNVTKNLPKAPVKKGKSNDVSSGKGLKRQRNAKEGNAPKNEFRII